MNDVAGVHARRPRRAIYRNWYGDHGSQLGGPAYDADMVQRLGITRIVVLTIALIPALFMAGLAAWALLFPEPERDAMGHPRCPLPAGQVAGSYLIYSVALVSLAVALGWLGPLGVWRRLVLVLITLPLAMLGTALVPSHLVC